MRRARLLLLPAATAAALALAACATSPYDAGTYGSLYDDPYYGPYDDPFYSPYGYAGAAPYGPTGYGGVYGDVFYDRWGDPYVVDAFGRARPLGGYPPRTVLVPRDPVAPIDRAVPRAPRVERRDPRAIPDDTIRARDDARRSAREAAVDRARARAKDEARDRARRR